MNTQNGYIEVLECPECGFLGTIDLYPVDNNQVWCPKCGNPYLGYSQVPYEWYVVEQERRSVGDRELDGHLDGFVETVQGQFPQWERKDKCSQ